MSRFTWNRSLGTLCFAAVLAGMLGFFSVTRAEPNPLPLPFTMADDQRTEMIGHLREIKELLKEQNAILRQLAKPEKHDPTRRP
jgi:hypothetical protein